MRTSCLLSRSPIERECGFLVTASDGKKPFQELEHTADLRVEIRGKDEQDLFRNAVESLYHLLGLPLVSECETVLPEASLEVRGHDAEEALVELLGELLYRANVENVRFHLHELSVRERGEEGGECRILLSGVWRAFEKRATTGQREIKAVTYHDVHIRRTEEGLSARVVMDL
jgi:SHS2 domain-containing protein